MDRPCYRHGAIPPWDFLDFSKYFDVSLHSAFEVYRVGANNDLFRYIVLLCGIRRTLLMIIFWGV